MKRLSLRIPDDLHARLETAAAANRRSINNEILAAIDAHTRGVNTMSATQIRWTDLELLDADNDAIDVNSETGLEHLAEFRRTGSMDTVFFARTGASHEDADDASTWGPQSPADVDWTGFPAIKTTVRDVIKAHLDGYILDDGAQDWDPRTYLEESIDDDSDEFLSREAVGVEEIDGRVSVMLIDDRGYQQSPAALVLRPGVCED